MDTHTAGGRVFRLLRAIRVVWAVFLVAGLSWLAVTFREFNLLAFAGVDPLMVLQNAAAVVAAFALSQSLMRKRLFRWRPSDLVIRRKDSPSPGQAAAGSILVTAMRVPLIGAFVTCLFVFNLPTIAALEELLFREGTTGWKSMLVRSALFGAAHLGADLPLASAISIGLVGTWFSHWYFLGGIELSMQAHFSYLLVIFALAAPAVLYGNLRALFKAPHR